MGVRRCLARSFTSLALRCALQRVQTVPAVIHSGRMPPLTTPSNRGRKTQTAPPHHTGPGPFRTLIVSSLKGGGTLSLPLHNTDK